MQQPGARSEKTIHPQVFLPPQHVGRERACHDENIFSTNASVKMKLFPISGSHNNVVDDATMSGTSGHRVHLDHGRVSDTCSHDHHVTANSETGPVANSQTGPGANSETGPVANSETGPVANSETGPGANSETGSVANRCAAIVDINAVSHTSKNNIVVPSEVDDVFSRQDVAANESSPPDEQHLGKGTMQEEVHLAEVHPAEVHPAEVYPAEVYPAEVHPAEAAASLNNISSKGNRNPEFYSPTRKLDLTKKLSNKGLSEPLPGDVEEAVPVKKKQNPLKRFFARKKGRFDPLTSDVSQDELPGTDPSIDGRGNKKHETLTSDPDIDSKGNKKHETLTSDAGIDGKGNKKHETLTSKLRLRMGKKKSREALDLNSSLCVGSNLEIDQMEDHPAARATHRPHFDDINSDIKINGINIDFSMTKRDEVSSKGKCKPRGKLTKENIIVMKSTGKLLSDCGSASLECVSLTPKVNATEETAQPSVNRQNHDEHRQSAHSKVTVRKQSGDSQVTVRKQSGDSQVTVRKQSGDSQQHQVLPDNADDLAHLEDLAHLDEMLDHIYANFTPMATVLLLPGKSDDDLHASDVDEAKGINGIVQAERIDVGQLEDKVQAERIVVGQLEDKVQAETIDVGHLDDKVQNGKVDVGNIDHKVQECCTRIESIDNVPQEAKARIEHIDIPQEAMACIEHIDMPQEAMACIEHMDIPHEPDMCTENMNAKVQGREKSRKSKDNKVPEEMRVETIVEKMQEGGLIVDKILGGELIVDKNHEGEIIVESTHEKVQGREIIVEKQDDMIQDRKFGTENTNDIYPNYRKVAADNCEYDVDGGSSTMTGESEHLLSVYDQGLREVKRNSLFSNKVSEKENHSIIESDPSMTTVLDTRHADRVDSLKNKLGPSTADTHAIDCTGGGDESLRVNITSHGDESSGVNITSHGDESSGVNITSHGDDSSGVNITSPGAADHAPASDKLTPDVNISFDPTYDFVEDAPTVDDVPQDDTHAIHKEHCWSAPADVIEHEVVTQDVTTSSDVTQDINTYSVISQDGVSQATTILAVEKRADTKPDDGACSCLANEFPVSNQAGLCLTRDDPEEIKSDFATNDIPKLETAVCPSPYSLDNSEVESVHRYGLDEVDASIRFTERMQETILGFCRQGSTCKLSGDQTVGPSHQIVRPSHQIVRPNHQIGTNKDGTVQTKVKQTRTDNGLNHLVLFPDPLVIHNIQLNLSSWQTQSAGDHLRLAGKPQAASISLSLDKPPIKPKPLTATSSQHTTKAANAQAQAERRRRPLESHTAVADVNDGDPAPTIEPQAGTRMIAVECLKKELAETWTQDLGKKNKDEGDSAHVDRSSSCKLSGGTLQAHSSRVQEKLTTVESKVRDKHRIDEKGASTEERACRKDATGDRACRKDATGERACRKDATGERACRKDATDSFHRAEVSTTNTRDTSTRDTQTRDTENSGNSENALDRVTGNKPGDDSGHVTDGEAEAIAETADNGRAGDNPDNKVHNLVAVSGVGSGRGVPRRDMDRDNVYDEIFEDPGLKDVSCLTSKRFQFPWKKKDKKLDKRKEMKDSDNIVGEDKVKVKPTKEKPNIKPHCSLKASACSRSKSRVQSDKNTSAKRRLGKVKRKSASFSLVAEESLYHEIDEALWQTEGALEDSSSSSSSTSEEDLGYEPINYLQTDTDNKERETVSLRQETLGYTRSLLNSADSLGYEIPAKVSLKAMEPATHNGGGDASWVKQPPDLDSSTRNQETNEGDDGTQRRHEADLCSCEDLPAIGPDVSWDTDQLEFSSFSTKVDTREDSVSQRDVSGGVWTFGHQFPHEMISRDEKPRGDTVDGENSHTFQTCTGNSVSGVSAAHISAEAASHVQRTENRERRTENREQITKNIDSGSSNILEGTSLGDINGILRVTATAECYHGECSSPSQSVSREDRSPGATGSSNSSGRGKDRTSMPDRIKNMIAQTKDGSSGLSENVKGDNLTALNSGMVEKTGRLGDVKPLTDKELGDRSMAATAKVNVDIHSPHCNQSERGIDVQAPMAAAKNREMLAGYKQVVKSLAAYFVLNNDSDNCHAMHDNTASQGIGCSNNTDLPEKVCRHDNQRGSQVSPDMPSGLHPVFGVEASRSLQSPSCTETHGAELSSSVQTDTGMTPQKHRQSNVFRDETQETPKELFLAASYPSCVPGCSQRRCLSLRDTHTPPTGNPVGVMRSLDSNVGTGNHSDATRQEVLRRSSSLPARGITCARVVSHQELSGATPTCQSTHSQRGCFRQQKHLITDSQESSLEKFIKLVELACSPQEKGIYTDAESSPSSQPETKHSYVRGIPPIPDIVATPATDDGENLTQPPESEADGMTEYDLPPVRAKRISQSKVWSWPGLPVSHTTEASAETPLKPASQSLHPPGSNKAEYAAPWEGKSLESLTPTLQHFNRQSSTEPGQPAARPHHAGSDQGTTDGRQTPPSSEPLDERFVVSLASRANPTLVGQDDVETTRMFGRRHRKLPSEGDNEDTSARKSNFLSDASEEEGANLDLISRPLRLSSEGEAPEDQTMPSDQRVDAVSASTKDAQKPGDTAECPVAMVTNGRALCRLLKMHENRARTVELVQPWVQYRGLAFTKVSRQTAAEGVFVAAFEDSSCSKLLAGFLDVGDQLLDIDGVEVSHMTLEEVDHVVQSKQHMTITILPVNADDCQ